MTNLLRFLLVPSLTWLIPQANAAISFQNDTLVEACQRRFGVFKQVADLPIADDESKRTPLQRLLTRCLLTTAIVSLPYMPPHYTDMREIQYLRAKSTKERMSSKWQKWTKGKTKGPQAVDDTTYVSECLQSSDSLTQFQAEQVKLIKQSWCPPDEKSFGEETETKSAKTLRHSTLGVFFLCVVGGLAQRNHRDAYKKMVRNYLYPILYTTACGATQSGKYQDLPTEVQHAFGEKIDTVAAFFFATVGKRKLDVPCFSTDVKFHDQL